MQGKESNTNTISRRELLVIKPECELGFRTERLDDILGSVLKKIKEQGIDITYITKVSQLDDTPMKGKRVLFAICLSEAGVNMEYYRLLEGFRAHPDCLEGSVGGIIVDGNSELFTKALARRLAFSANMAGCTFPGKPLVEATGSLGNFYVLSGIRGEEPYEVYRQQVGNLVEKIMNFDFPGERAGEKTGEQNPYGEETSNQKRLNILALHASSRKTSNTLLLWDKVKQNLEEHADIHEISLRNGTLQDCRGCPYETCLHFGEAGECFYGGIITEQVYPAILECDVLVMICPNYNDALSANLTAFINRLTALFRVHDFSRKRIYALVISGYSGGDIVSEQIIGALNFNKSFILPGRFAMVETANDPYSILSVPEIDDKALKFAESIIKNR